MYLSNWLGAGGRWLTQLAEVLVVHARTEGHEVYAARQDGKETRSRFSHSLVGGSPCWLGHVLRNLKRACHSCTHWPRVGCAAPLLCLKKGIYTRTPKYMCTCQLGTPSTDLVSQQCGY